MSKPSEQTIIILKILSKSHGKVQPMLNHENDFQLLVATILSAQCTDVQVNKITPKLFKKFPTPRKMASAPLNEVKNLVKTTGFYNNKAKNIIDSSKMIMSKNNGNVPETMMELIELPGVARKTANIVLTNCFHKVEGIAVDTHVKRISFRLGWTKSKNPDIIERDLMRIIPKRWWNKVNHHLVLHGREICQAQKPRCEQCQIQDFCPKIGIYN